MKQIFIGWVSGIFFALCMFSITHIHGQNIRHLTDVNNADQVGNYEPQLVGLSIHSHFIPNSSLFQLFKFVFSEYNLESTYTGPFDNPFRKGAGIIRKLIFVCELDESGSIVNLTIEQCVNLGNEEEILDHLMRTVWRPALNNFEPVSCERRYIVNFESKCK